jgi:hypothetical protein
MKNKNGKPLDIPYNARRMLAHPIFLTDTVRGLRADCRDTFLAGRCTFIDPLAIDMAVAANATIK